MTVPQRLIALSLLLLLLKCDLASAQTVYLSNTGPEWDGNCNVDSPCNSAESFCSFPADGSKITIFGTTNCGILIRGSFAGLEVNIDAQSQTYFGFYVIGPTRNLNLNVLSKVSWEMDFVPAVGALLNGGSINAFFNATGKTTFSLNAIPLTNNPISVADWSPTVANSQGVALTVTDTVVKMDTDSPFQIMTNRGALYDTPAYPMGPTPPIAPTPIASTPEGLFGRGTLTLTNVNVSLPTGSGDLDLDIPLLSALSTCLYDISISNSVNISAAYLARSFACPIASGSAKVTIANSSWYSLTNHLLQFPVPPAFTATKLDWNISSSTLQALTRIAPPPGLAYNLGTLNQTLSTQNARLDYLSLANLSSVSISNSSFYNVDWTPTKFDISGAYFEMNLPSGSPPTSLTLSSILGPAYGIVVNDSSASSSFSIVGAVELSSPNASTSVLTTNRITMAPGSSLKLRELTVTEAVEGSGIDEGRSQLGRQIGASRPSVGPQLTFHPSVLANTSLELGAVPMLNLIVPSAPSAFPLLISSSSNITGAPQSIYIKWNDPLPPASGVEYIITEVSTVIEGWSLNSTVYTSSDYLFSVYTTTGSKRDSQEINSLRSAPPITYPRMVFKFVEQDPSTPITSPNDAPLDVPATIPSLDPTTTPQAPSCPQPIPVGFICVDGHIVAPGGVSSNTTIVLPGQAGVILVSGNLTVGGSVTFSGFGSSINVSGCIQITGGIIIDLRNIKNLPKGLFPLITQNANCTGTNLSQIPITVQNDDKSCESVKARKQGTETKDNKQTLSVVFYLDNSGCNTKWIILGAVLGGLIVIAVIVIIVTSTVLKSKRHRREKSRVATS